MMTGDKNSFKIVIIGDSKVGKTSLITRYIKNNFEIISDRTVNAYNLEKSMVINDKTIKLHIWVNFA
jgi:GTPase SAR1 family protein